MPLVDATVELAALELAEEYVGDTTDDGTLPVEATDVALLNELDNALALLELLALLLLLPP